jgi:hypothetical protein
MCVLDSDLLSESLWCNLLVEAGLLLDFGQDANNPKYQWTIFRMDKYPALLFHEVVKLNVNAWSHSKCLSVLEEAKQLLVSQLKIYVTDKGILPVYPGVMEVLFAVDKKNWHPTGAEVISWREWKHMRVRMKVPAV